MRLRFDRSRVRTFSAALSSHSENGKGQKSRHHIANFKNDQSMGFSLVLFQCRRRGRLCIGRPTKPKEPAYRSQVNTTICKQAAASHCSCLSSSYSSQCDSINLPLLCLSRVELTISLCDSRLSVEATNFYNHNCNDEQPVL